MGNGLRVWSLGSDSYNNVDESKNPDFTVKTYATVHISNEDYDDDGEGCVDGTSER